MADKQVKQYNVPNDRAGRTGNATVEDWQSPTGAWCADWDPETKQAMPLTDKDGDYIPYRGKRK